MDTFKNCENCSHLKPISIKKILCDKSHFVAVDKEKFFYSPEEKLKDRNPFFLNKYISLSNAIECKDYDPIQFIVISSIEIEEPPERKVEYTGSRQRYGDIFVNVLYVLSGIKKIIVYENMSFGSKTRAYFITVKKYVDMRRDFSII